MQIKVVERAQQIQVQEQEIVRKARELEATIKKPADADRFKLEKMAEANKLVRHKSDAILMLHQDDVMLMHLKKLMSLFNN